MSQRGPLSEADVRACLQAAIMAAGSQRAWADRHGISQGYVAKIALGRRHPSEKVLAALGLRELPPAYGPADPDDQPGA